MSTEEILDVSAPSTSRPVAFDDSQFKIRSRSFMVVGQPEVPSVIRMLVKGGIAKTEKQAVTIIVIAVVVLLIASVLLINRSVAVAPAKINPGLLRI